MRGAEVALLLALEGASFEPVERRAPEEEARHCGYCSAPLHPGSLRPTLDAVPGDVLFCDAACRRYYRVQVARLRSAVRTLRGWGWTVEPGR